ncbi:hypothetical protein PAMP_006135 [Pampus punctatissimus]
MAAKAAVRGLAWRVFSPFTPRAASNSRHRSSSQATQQDNTLKRPNFRPPASSTHDWIGPPNLLSNLRPIIYHVPKNESELEKQLRHLRQETEDWNHNFWTKQNINFKKEKHAFIISQLKAKGLSVRDEQGRQQSLNSEEMAVFYKGFLDNNRTLHANYNKEWYRRNFTITLLMARVALHNMWRTVTHKHNSKKNSTPPT